MNETKKFSFPLEQKITNDVLSKSFWKCLYRSAEPQMHYWILLPNNVSPIRITPEKNNNTTIIGTYATNDDSPYLEVEVLYEYCRYEINASDWALKKIKSMGDTVLDYKIIEGKSDGKYIDALTCSQFENGDEIISRVTVQKDSVPKGDGVNLFLVRASCLSKDYESLAYEILQIITNWDLLNKSEWQLAESIKPFIYPTENKVEFYFPYSWYVAYDPEKIKTESPRFIFKHEHDSDNISIINVYFYKNAYINKYETIFNRAFERLKTLEGFTYKLNEFETIDIDKIKNPFIDAMWITEGLFESENENYLAFLKIIIIKIKEKWYYFELLGPIPSPDNYYWEISKRCFELMIDSFNNLDFEKKDV